MSKKPDAAAWMAARGWSPFPFQRDVWDAMARGESGLLHATTGAGKTYAVWLGALQALADATSKRTPPLTVVWLTPMRALAADTLLALQTPLPDLAPAWTAGARSGDTSTSERAKQTARLPTVLVTTPESLSLLIARADAAETLGRTALVVVDEWHELMGNKRGVQAQLAIARLRQWNPALRVWGMSATLGNLGDAMHTLLGPQAAAQGRMVRGQTPKQLTVDTLLPPRVDRFPWGGHLGLAMLPSVVQEIESSGSTLVFTNTRSQAEIWYQALLDAKPEWAGLIALHHGSLDRSVREWVEGSLKAGELRAVVCTSSLDLGVDFLPVERVLQIGSPKGIARLLQRAGRSGHAPGRPSRVTIVPTHSLELVEGAAARAAVQAGQIEARDTPRQPLDVLVQHLVTVALGGGFTPDALLAEIRTTAAYADLSEEHWRWCLDFVSQGGASLAAYPDYHRVVADEQGVWRVPDARLARRHRMNIGTIVSDASMAVQYMGGGKIGHVEESFAARLKPGDCFLFGGRLLELVRIHDMTAWVKRVKPSDMGRKPAVPRWNGGKMPLSTTLADAVVAQLARVQDGNGWADIQDPELHAARPLLELQAQWSALPSPGTLLAEVMQSREGTHLFLYPFAGRHANMGLGNLIAWRVAQRAANTFSIAVNDYGVELLSATAIDWPNLLPELLSNRTDATPPVRPEPAEALCSDHPELVEGRAQPERHSILRAEDTKKEPPADAALLHEVLQSLNASELAQRHFREIARVSGLIFQSHPGEKRSSRQLQASSSLFWEVFRKYDPGNQLLLQAEAELLAQELDIGRLREALRRMAQQTLVLKNLERPTPFAFPLMIERLREKLSNESVADRITRMLAQLEKAAGGAESNNADAVHQTLAFGREGAPDKTPKTASDRPARERRPRRPRLER